MHLLVIIVVLALVFPAMARSVLTCLMWLILLAFVLSQVGSLFH